MEKKRIKFFYRVIAFLISLMVTIPLFFSHFTLPVELVLTNNLSYYPVIENDDFSKIYPEIVAELLTSEIYDSKFRNEIPAFFSNRNSLENAIKKSISHDWSRDTLRTFIDQITGYFNFKLPLRSLRIDLGELKLDLITKSKEISRFYILSLNNCTVSVEEANLQDESAINELSSCKPEEDLIDSYILLASRSLEDLINQLPSSISIVSITQIQNFEKNNYFFYYSIARWVLRLLPLVVIGILIVIAVLLRNQQDYMLRWIGQLLVYVSGISFIFLIVILIGFDQIISLLTSRILGYLVEGFDEIVIGWMQDVGYKTIVWVSVSVALTFGFGLFLHLVSRIFKPKAETENPADEELREASSGEFGDINLPKKEIVPQSIEEIEAGEKENLTTKRKK